MRVLFFVITLTLFNSGCKLGYADDPLDPGYSTEPVFFLTADFGTQSFDIQAGYNDIYHFTQYFQDPTGRFHCAGSFARTNCPDATCSGSYTLDFRTPVLDTSIVALPQLEGNPDFFVDKAEGNLYKGRFVAEVSPPSGSEAHWLLGDTFDITGNTVSRYFTNPEPKTITYAVKTGVDSVKSLVTRTFYPGEPDRCFSLGIKKTKLAGDTIRLEAIVTPASASQYVELTWFDDHVEPVRTLVLDNNISISVQAKNNDGCTAFASLGNFPTSDSMNVISNYGFGMSAQTIPVTELGGVSIRWVQNETTTWRSDLNVQPGSAYFEISKSESYLSNENGARTIKFKVNYNCLLFNDLGEHKWLKGNGVIGVALP